jgi:hypothetical protein
MLGVLPNQATISPVLLARWELPHHRPVGNTVANDFTTIHSTSIAFDVVVLKQVCLVHIFLHFPFSFGCLPHSSSPELLE